ncbi:MAG: hypothetical protein A2W61_07505 [Deltaproteobacteria bacterium RIFCSPLOWO2_01_44_7]|nr:MAG: hypothetical protein A2712_08625 [Deltaproteobacteria bacterium RIFCSPHIGHO2_01_FULL_43_49]OGQ14598.1 MAG: hypothetical protein A3D22_08375 [Deltaproteobacteria bacterium RIFCSPHIGHO2_02_FULL_44_53]OGQ27984.1 MAG: hypothetical protein A3D98_07085 [Deltaproteobacteria bacterium RIFCSPHIGHO2_12_FULL_44_21]OGQ31196.1 MAG: hypothetical protein A2979_07135 [Deltaproteobacteria bacterium RIFCSPLOWO2_01_FULL_45_74]OGQ37976.1 MAG: hypothetical protein A2W61_07505 [Deltaproteobacteria bacterium 
MATSSFLFYVIILILLLFSSAFHSASETTLFSLSRAQLAQLKKSRQPLNKQLLHFLSKPRDVLVTILFGNEFTNVAISIIIADLVYKILSPYDLHQSTITIIAVAIGTTLVLIFGEILPKNIAIHYANSMAPFVALLLSPLYWLIKPFRILMVKFSEWIIAKFGGEPQKETPLIVEEEFRYLVELGATTGQLAEGEKDLIHKALEFSDKVVSQIMTPMNLVFALPAEMSYLELLKQIKATQFSRIPIFEKNSENIIGLLYVKDLFEFNRRWQQDHSLTIHEIVRPPLFVSQKKRLEELLQQLREAKIHMAVVVSDHKKPLGVVTMHDVLEELFGEVEL